MSKRATSAEPLHCHDGRATCGRCGWSVACARPVVYHVCRGPRPSPGVGDMVAGALAAVGITEERVSRLLGRPCRCQERKEALNRLFGGQSG